MDRPPQLWPRRAMRIPLRTECLVSEGSPPRFLGYVGNVSRGGAFLQCVNPRPVGTRLDIVMHLSRDGENSIPCTAEVVWSRGYRGKLGPCPGMGVRFVGVEEDAQAALADLCREEA